MGNLTWDIESRVIQALGEEPNHETPPNGTLYVLPSLRSDVITSAHSSCISCHGGIHRTLNLIRRRFFWPSMNKDIRKYVAACPTCARFKSSHSPPSGYLHPLPTPSRPLIPHRRRFCYWTTHFSRQLRNIHCNWSIFQVCLFYSTSPVTYRHRNCWHPGLLHLPSPWHTCWHCFRSWSTIHLSSLEILLFCPGSHGQSYLRLPPSV